MENWELNHALSAGFIEKKEISTRNAEDVIRFLREYNFGNKNESARVAVLRFIEYIKKRHQVPERLLPGEPKVLDLMIDKLDEAGFLRPGTISRGKWTKKAERALFIALKNFESHNKKWQAKVGKTHQHLAV